MELLPQSMLPVGFEYPKELLRIIDQQLTNLCPWKIDSGKLLVEKSEGLKKRYPHLTVVPFAVRLDNDDVACFFLDNSVCIIHDYGDRASAPREKYENFWVWFKVVVDDMIEYGEDVDRWET